MKTFNQREYETIKNTFITSIENPVFMNDKIYLSLLKEDFDNSETGINLKILDFVFSRTNLMLAMSIVEFCYKFVPNFNDEQFVEISNEHDNLTYLFSHFPGNKKLLKLFPGTQEELYEKFKKFSIDYANELHRHVHGRDFILE